MKLAICVATMQQPPSGDYYPGMLLWSPGDIPSWLENQWCRDGEGPIEAHIRVNTPENNLGVVGSYQALYEESTEDILAFIHDDVICREQGWNKRILKEFEDERVMVCGFGGALQHGDADLYKQPYRLQALKRHHYRSNVDDAEVHGERFTGSCNVAVLDGFALICRRSFLDRIGGFTALKCNFYNYDYAISALARRHGFGLRCVGVRCHHRGGGTSVTQRNGITGQEAYDQAHWWFYEEFKDVMPCRVNP